MGKGYCGGAQVPARQPHSSWRHQVAQHVCSWTEDVLLDAHHRMRHSLLFMQQPGEQLTAKLTDFGMAKVRAAANNTTNIDTRKGTVAWQPPGMTMCTAPKDNAHVLPTHTEAFKSEVRPLKSDVYSFAMVLYELVTGKTPFHDLANVSMVCHTHGVVVHTTLLYSKHPRCTASTMRHNCPSHRSSTPLCSKSVLLSRDIPALHPSGSSSKTAGWRNPKCVLILKRCGELKRAPLCFSRVLCRSKGAPRESL